MSAGANEVATGKVILLAKIAALTGQERYKLYQRFGLSRVWVCIARPAIWKGGERPPGAQKSAFPTWTGCPRRNRGIAGQ